MGLGSERPDQLALQPSPVLQEPCAPSPQSAHWLRMRCLSPGGQSTCWHMQCGPIRPCSIGICQRIRPVCLYRPEGRLKDNPLLLGSPVCIQALQHIQTGMSLGNVHLTSNAWHHHVAVSRLRSYVSGIRSFLLSRGSCLAARAPAKVTESFHPMPFHWNASDRHQAASRKHLCVDLLHPGTTLSIEAPQRLSADAMLPEVPPQHSTCARPRPLSLRPIVRLASGFTDLC